MPSTERTRRDIPGNARKGVPRSCRLFVIKSHRHHVRLTHVDEVLRRRIARIGSARSTADSAGASPRETTCDGRVLGGSTLTLHREQDRVASGQRVW